MTDEKLANSTYNAVTEVEIGSLDAVKYAGYNGTSFMRISKIVGSHGMFLIKIHHLTFVSCASMVAFQN